MTIYIISQFPRKNVLTSCHISRRAIELLEHDRGGLPSIIEKYKSSGIATESTHCSHYFLFFHKHSVQNRNTYFYELCHALFQRWEQYFTPTHYKVRLLTVLQNTHRNNKRSFRLMLDLRLPPAFQFLLTKSAIVIHNSWSFDAVELHIALLESDHHHRRMCPKLDCFILQSRRGFHEFQ